MKENGSKLGITEGIVERTERKLNGEENNIAEYVQSVMSKMMVEQPSLALFLREIRRSIDIEDEFIYFLAVAMSYDMISQSLPESAIKYRITPSTLEVVRHDIFDHVDLTEGKREIDLIWFYDRLQKDSPAFTDWLSDMTSQLGRFKERTDFILGALLVAVPFFKVIEAEELENSFLRQGPEDFSKIPPPFPKA